MDSIELAVWMLVAVVAVAVVMGGTVVLKRGLWKPRSETPTVAESTAAKEDTPASVAVDATTSLLRQVNDRARKAADRLAIAQIGLWAARDDQRAEAVERRTDAMTPAEGKPVAEEG